MSKYMRLTYSSQSRPVSHNGDGDANEDDASHHDQQEDPYRTHPLLFCYELYFCVINKVIYFFWYF